MSSRKVVYEQKRKTHIIVKKKNIITTVKQCRFVKEILKINIFIFYSSTKERSEKRIGMMCFFYRL